MHRYTQHHVFSGLKKWLKNWILKSILTIRVKWALNTRYSDKTRLSDSESKLLLWNNGVTWITFSMQSSPRWFLLVFTHRGRRPIFTVPFSTLEGPSGSISWREKVKWILNPLLLNEGVLWTWTYAYKVLTLIATWGDVCSLFLRHYLHSVLSCSSS